MDICDNFNQKTWRKGDANDSTGFKRYRIGKLMGPDGPYRFAYAVFDDNTGDLYKVYLNDAISKRDPLNGVGNVELRLSEDKKTITGIILDDDCMLYTS